MFPWIQTRQKCPSSRRFINQTIMTKKVNYVLEADIKGFFDNVNHDLMMKFLEHDIADKNFLRYVKRFLNAGVMEETERKESEKETPQGVKSHRYLPMCICITHWICFFSTRIQEKGNTELACARARRN